MAYASSTARTVFVGIPNQSVVVPRSRSKSSDDSGPSARIFSSTRSATSAFSASVRGALLVDGRAEPGELAGRDEGEALVVRLEDLAAFVQQLAPGGLVVGDPRVQHEVVRAAGNRDRVELDRAEPAEDLEHGIGASLERSRWCEEAPGDEKAARGLSGDLHGQESIRERRDSTRDPATVSSGASRDANGRPEGRPLPLTGERGSTVPAGGEPC